MADDPTRLLVLGLDGATFRLLDPLMARGAMPYLAALIGEGVRRELTTVFPPVTATAWASFATGRTPGGHGILDFAIRDPKGGGVHPATLSDQHGETVWGEVSRAGRRVSVLNLPLGYPPEPVRGTWIAGFLTPPGRRDYASPPGLLEAIEARLGPYPLHAAPVYTPGRGARILAELERITAYKFEAAHLVQTWHPADLLFLHIWETDRLQHELWHVWDEAHPLHDPSEGARLREGIVGYFRALDARIERLHESMPAHDIVILSDHGFGPVEKFLHVNVWLHENGWLAFREERRWKERLFAWGWTPRNLYVAAMRAGLAHWRLKGGVTGRRRIADWLDRLCLSFHDVDWERTRAYARGYYGQIFVNLAGREPFGSVTPEAYPGVVEEIVAGLRDLRDPESGEPVIGEVWRREEVYSGPFLEQAPDVVFLPRTMRYKAMGVVDFPSNRTIEPVYANPGDHRMSGILIAQGRGFQRGVHADPARIIDLAPTILHLMDLPIPAGVEGRVLTGMLAPDHARRPIRRLPPSPTAVSSAPSNRGEEEERLRDLLRNLGYLG
ncbi:MAG: hypothetical protein D6795_16355 [Deltaproteobacteria bacterium]|nr:MAG: hypothetical protein D6795_16355 [Deltaproteobacteria bacterium]